MSLVSNGIDASQWSLTENEDEAEIIFGSWEGDLPSNVRWIQLPSVDISSLNINKDVLVTNMQGVFAEFIAESVLGSLLAYYRGLFDVQRATIRGEWQRWPIRSSMGTLRNKVIVFLGGGKIVEALIPLLNAFGGERFVFRKKNKPIAETQLILSKEKLMKILKNTDVVVNTLPSSKETNYFVDRVLLGSMSSSAVLINVGRGSTVDEQALINALKENQLAAAILDVTQEEPINQHSVLNQTPHLFLTQHIAGGHCQEEEMKCDFFAKNLKRYITKQELLNVVYL